MKSILRAWWLAGVMLLTGSVFGEDRIPWVADFNTACGMAAEQRRLVLLHFYNDNCGPCVRLDQNVFSKAEVADAVSQNYLAVKVHAGKNPQLATRYHINQWPTDVFVTASGLEVFRTVSPQKPTDYIAVLNQVALQSGVTATRLGNNPMQQAARAANGTAQGAASSAQATVNNAAASATAGVSGAMAFFGQQAQQASNQTQQAAAEAQQKWNTAKQQAQTAYAQTRTSAETSVRQVAATAEQTQQQVATTASQWSNQAQTGVQQVQAGVQNAEQQATAAIQKTTDTAKQWGGEINSTVQRYEQQAGDAYRQVRDQATQTSDQVQQQVQNTKQEWQTTATQTTQEVTTAAQNLKQQAAALSSSLLDRRSAFVPVEASPAAAATTPVAAPPTFAAPGAPEAVANAPSGASAATSEVPTSSQVATNPAPRSEVAVTATPASSKAPALVDAAQPTTSPTATVTSNPWMGQKQAASPASNWSAPPFVAAEPKPNVPAFSPPAQANAAPALAAIQQPSQQPPAPVSPAAPPEATFGNHQMVPVSQAPQMALDGFCPVTLMERMAANPGDRAAWKKGDKRFGAIHNGRTYLFTSAEQQQKFLANPDAYAPVLSGCDPVLYAERGQLVDGKRAYGLVTPDKHIYLFADETSRSRFEQSPAGYSAAVQQAMARNAGGNVYR